MRVLCLFVGLAMFGLGVVQVFSNLGNREHIVHETPKKLIVVTTFQILLRAKSAS